MNEVEIEMQQFKKLCQTVENMKSILKSGEFTNEEKVEFMNTSIDILDRNL